jgi:hypothetical protein
VNIEITITKSIAMAMTATERKRLQVERDKERAKRLPDLVYGLARPPLGAWLEEHGDPVDLEQVAICFDGMNMEPPSFDSDGGPVSKTGNFVYPTTEDGELSYPGALGRAELDVALLLEAAKSLASLLNAYKRDVIETRIAAIEAEDLSDPQIRRRRLDEIVILKKALERLDKSVRTDVNQWQLRG